MAVVGSSGGVAGAQQWTTPGSTGPAPPAATAAQAPPTQPYGPNMTAGGLAPPPPMPSAPPPQAPPTGGVEQQLDKAKEEDSGRGLSWVWLEVEGGFEHV